MVKYIILANPSKPGGGKKKKGRLYGKKSPKRRGPDKHHPSSSSSYEQKKKLHEGWGEQRKHRIWETVGVGISRTPKNKFAPYMGTQTTWGGGEKGAQRRVTAQAMLPAKGGHNAGAK